MAIVKRPGEEQAGGVPVVSSGGGGRAKPAAGWSRPMPQGSGGSSGPGFVNISRMLSLNQGQGKAQADAITAGQAERGEGIKQTTGELQAGFDQKQADEQKASGVGDDGFNGQFHSPTVYAKNEQYANHTYNAPNDLRDVDSQKYDKAVQDSANIQNDLNSLSTDGGITNSLNAKYGTNANQYGSSFDAALTRENGQQQISDLQNRYSGIYNTLAGANDAAVAVAKTNAQKAAEAKAYHKGQYEQKKGEYDKEQHEMDIGAMNRSNFFMDSDGSGKASQNFQGSVPYTYEQYQRNWRKNGGREEFLMTPEEFAKWQQYHRENTNPGQPRQTGTTRQG